jgi:hypothetical protein
MRMLILNLASIICLFISIHSSASYSIKNKSLYEVKYFDQCKLGRLIDGINNEILYLGYAARDTNNYAFFIKFDNSGEYVADYQFGIANYLFYRCGLVTSNYQYLLIGKKDKAINIDIVDKNFNLIKNKLITENHRSFYPVDAFYTDRNNISMFSINNIFASTKFLNYIKFQMINEQGELIFNRDYMDKQRELERVIQDNDGNYFAFGYVNDDKQNDNFFMLINDNGKVTWEIYDDYLFYPKSVILEGGHFLCCGLTRSEETIDSLGCIPKTWTPTIYRISHDGFIMDTIIIDIKPYYTMLFKSLHNGNYAVIGGDPDLACPAVTILNENFQRITELTFPEWAEYMSTFNDAIMTEKGLLVFGSEFNGVIISALIQDQPNSINSNELVISATPNPFTKQLTINLSGDVPKQAKIEIYDVQGCLVNSLMVNGTNQVVWDGKDFNSYDCKAGIYFFRISNAASSVTGKVVVVR